MLPYTNENCGLGTYGHNGCAPIAIYNAMQLLRQRVSLQSVTDEFFWNHGMVAFGLLGVGPWSMDSYFDAHGVEYAGSYSADALTANIPDGSIIVFTAMFSHGWHAMTALYTNGEYWIFNQYDNVPVHRSYTSINQAYKNGWWVYGYRIDP